MRPSRLHYFFANEWPSTIWITVIPLTIFVFIPVVYHSVLDEFGGIWPNLGSFLYVAFLSLPLGYFVAILTGWFTLGPLYYNRALKNGEPFHDGELVQILTGPHRDLVVRVEKAWDDEPWAGGHRIRVVLGEKERREKRDVFNSLQIVRVAPDQART